MEGWLSIPEHGNSAVLRILSEEPNLTWKSIKNGLAPFHLETSKHLYVPTFSILFLVLSRVLHVPISTKLDQQVAEGVPTGKDLGHHAKPLQAAHSQGRPTNRMSTDNSILAGYDACWMLKVPCPQDFPKRYVGPPWNQAIAMIICWFLTNQRWQ